MRKALDFKFNFQTKDGSRYFVVFTRDKVPEYILLPDGRLFESKIDLAEVEPFELEREGVEPLKYMKVFSNRKQAKEYSDEHILEISLDAIDEEVEYVVFLPLSQFVSPNLHRPVFFLLSDGSLFKCLKFESIIGYEAKVCEVNCSVATLINDKDCPAKEAKEDLSITSILVADSLVDVALDLLDGIF